MFEQFKLYIVGAALLALVGGAAWLIHERNSAQREVAALKLQITELQRDAETKLAAANAAALAASKKATALQLKASNEYQSNLALLRAAYAARVRAVDPEAPVGPGSLPGLSVPAGRPDVPAADAGLAARCAETTLQLTSLQDWINRARSIDTVQKFSP